MARKLDLRTGTPVWSAYRAPAVPVAQLTRDIMADVLVVGMGISGAMIAEALTAAGLSVVCLDRRGPLKGSTAATTALVQFEIDQPLTRLSAMIGRSKAEQAWRRSRLAVVNLAERITALGIRCDCRPRESLYLAGDVLDTEALQEEARARRAAGLGAAFLAASDTRERFGVGRAAILSGHNLAIDPRKLTSGLLRLAIERGARCYAPVEVAGIEDRQDEVVALTRHGPTVTAKHLVLATGYELADIVPATRHSIISTWAIATRPQPRALWPEDVFLWEASDPYLYMRTTRDGRVICGGEDEPFQDEERRDRLIAEKTDRIAAKLAKLFPKLDVTPEFRWAGAFGSTTTGLPFIGFLPRHPRIFAAMGYGGNGITFSQIASEAIRTFLEGHEDRDTGLFDFRR